MGHALLALRDKQWHPCPGGPHCMAIYWRMQMKSRLILDSNGWRLVLAATFLCILSVIARAAEKPNVVWIVSEDNSKHYLKLFDEAGAPTPNIDKLAASGIIYDVDETRISGRLAVDVVTEKIKACGNCRGCGKNDTKPRKRKRPTKEPASV